MRTADRGIRCLSISCMMLAAATEGQHIVRENEKNKATYIILLNKQKRCAIMLFAECFALEMPNASSASPGPTYGTIALLTELCLISILEVPVGIKQATRKILFRKGGKNNR